MPISVAARQAMFAQETGEAFLILLRIDHDNLDAPFLFVNNTVDVNSPEGVHIAYPFDLVLPSSDEDTDIIATLTIDNVSREITETIRELETPPTVKVTVVRATPGPSGYPEAEVLLPIFTLRDVTWDAMTISGELLLSDITTESYPAYNFTPMQFPGLFLVPFLLGLFF